MLISLQYLPENAICAIFRGYYYYLLDPGGSIYVLLFPNSMLETSTIKNTLRGEVLKINTWVPVPGHFSRLS